MKILGKLRHRNIIKLYALLMQGGSNYLILEYMENGNLYQALRREIKGGKPELDWIQRHKITVGAAKGIAYLHHNCSPVVIHRDIKSTNILLDEHYEPKIADFGIAKIAEDFSKGSDSSGFAGTHGYFAPVALYFRLFREHGFDVSQDLFKVFKDHEGNFKGSLSKDVKGILSLYDASYLAVEGEDILDDGKAFARMHLENVNKNNINRNLSELVNHALDLPLHIGIQRLEARWYIDAYERRQDPNHDILELAKLDYNRIQATHLNDVVDMSKWRQDLGLSKKLTFARDRLVEYFYWFVGITYEPEDKYLREWIIKFFILLTFMDDIFDVYSTLDEAKLLTQAFERWDVNEIEQLPDYMKLFFLAIYNFVNEMAYNAMREYDLDVLPYLRKRWGVLCRAYLLEGTWFHNKYKPTLNEYLDNAWVSSTTPLIMVHLYVIMHYGVTNEVLDYLEKDPDLVRWLALITRLTDDMETSKTELERGDVLKSLQCYMNEVGATEEVARKQIRYLTDEAWKKMNAQLRVDSPLPEALVKLVLNFARTIESIYQYGDGHGVPDAETKDRILSLLVDAIPVSQK